VIERGNNRGAIFLGADNYARYRDWLVEAAGSYGCAIHAYVLTTNHVHLLVTPRVGRDRPGRVRRAASWSLDMLGRSRTGRAAPLRRATRMTKRRDIVALALDQGDDHGSFSDRARRQPLGLPHEQRERDLLQPPDQVSGLAVKIGQ